VIQGEFKVSDDPNVVLSTILGSCVAACMRDPVAGVGGMNHFLLPGQANGTGGEATRYGVHLMELLINGLLKKGARRERIEAKIIGGAKTISGFLQCRREECGIRTSVPRMKAFVSSAAMLAVMSGASSNIFR
jgi:chemotaxis protein CheD